MTRQERRRRQRLEMLFVGLLGVGFLCSAPSSASAQAVRQLSALNESDGFRLDGEASTNNAGVSVSGAGDVNGDGFADMIIGAAGATPNGSNSGSTYIVFGKASGWNAANNLSSINGTNGVRINGAAVNDFSGRRVSAAGDVNGDGFGDVIIGAPGGDSNGNSSGSSYVVFGKASWTSPLDVSSLDGSNTSGFRIDGAAAYDGSGSAVSGAGDINGDGFADLVLGVYQATPNGSMSGSTYVVFGKGSGWNPVFNLSSLNASSDGTSGFRIDSLDFLDRFGRSVSAAGDVNGDGFGDLVIGADGVADGFNTPYGATYVVFGKASGWSGLLSLSSLDGTNGFVLRGADGDRSGGSVSTAGDVNGDGFADLIIGAYGAQPNGMYSGASYVVFGKASGWGPSMNLSSVNGTTGFRLDGTAAFDYAGWSVSGAGDINGDGFADLVVGAFGNASNGGGSGSSYIVFGKPSGWSPTLALSSLNGSDGFRENGAAANHSSGTSVSGAGDINSDGFADILVGAPGASPNGTASGSSYIVLGGHGPGATYRGRTLAGNAPKTPVGPLQPGGSPSSRMWLDFDGGSTISQERVTLNRSARTDLRNLDPNTDTSRTVWDVASNRYDWTTCVVTLQYTDAEIAGVSGGEAGLAIFRAPTPAGPWARISGATINMAANQISAPTGRLGYFTVASSSVPVTLAQWEIE